MSEEIKESETLYKLIISQLRYDGLDLVATSLSKCVGLEEVALAPSSRLLEIMKLGLQEEKAGHEPELRKIPGLTPLVQAETIGLETKVKHGLDLEYERDDELKNAYSSFNKRLLSEEFDCQYKACTQNENNCLHSPLDNNMVHLNNHFGVENGGIVHNLDLLSQVSLTRLSENFLSNETCLKEEFGSDQKLEFLSNLDLIPTPLMKECPNATKKWLKATKQQLSSCNNNGIDDSQLYRNPMLTDFTAVKDTLPWIPTSNKQNNDFRYSPTVVAVGQTLLGGPHLPASNTIRLQQSSSMESRMNSATPSHAASSAMPFETNRTNAEVFDTPENIVPIHDSNTFAFCDESSEKKTTEPSPTGCLTISRETLQKQVASEIQRHGINQTIFAACSIQKSQGYLSDLLLQANTYEASRNNVNKTNQLLWEVKKFLCLSEQERQNRYRKYKGSCQTRKAEITLDKKQKRTKISESAKQKLVHFLQSKHGHVCRDDIKQISENVDLTEETVKIFYKNFKQRKKKL